MRNEVKPCAFSNVLHASLPCDKGVRSHVVRFLLSHDVVYYLHGVRCRVCDASCSFPPAFLCCVVWCSYPASFMCSCDGFVERV